MLDNLRAFEYSNGNRFTFDLCDATGVVRCIGFNEAYEALFSNLKSGKTYKIHNVLPTASNGNGAAATLTTEPVLELKIYANTRFDAMPDYSVSPSVPVSEIASSSSKMVSLEGVLATLEDADGVSPLKSGSPCRRGRMQDKTGDIGVFFIDDAASSSFLVEGAVLKVVGKASKQGSLFVSVPPVKVQGETVTLTAWAEENPLKRARCDVTSLSDLSKVSDVEPGTRADFVCVVRSCSLPGMTASGSKRRVLSVVDKSMCGIDVSVFDEGADKELNAGNVVKIRATVSPYNTRSLTCKNVEVVQDDDLQSWWSLSKAREFNNLSVEPISRTTGTEEV